MRVIEWRKVLDENRVSYVERGANVSRGEINIRCPYCGSADPSFHMGLNQETGWWACWRNSDHRGKSPVRLLVAILGVSYHAARDIAGLGPGYIDPDGFDEIASRLLRPKVTLPEAAEKDLQLPSSFRPIELDSLRASRYVRYLIEDRGFTRRDLPGLVAAYGLQYSLTGDFKDRIILPYYLAGKLVTWSGRSIANSTVRYRDLDRDSSTVPAKETLYCFDSAVGASVLVVVEGPFDALKLDFYGRRFGVRAVGLSTNSITDKQIYLLEQLTTRAKRTIIQLDTLSSLGIVGSMRLRDRIGHLPNLEILPVPYGKKDAGELSPREATAYARSLSADLEGELV